MAHMKGSYFQDLCRYLGMNQGETAAFFRTHRASVGRWEATHPPVAVAQVVLLMAALRVLPEEAEAIFQHNRLKLQPLPVPADNSA